jgi:hypothetical protein
MQLQAVLPEPLVQDGQHTMSVFLALEVRISVNLNTRSAPL